MTPKPSRTAHPNIYAELLQLSAKLSPWQNEILRRVFKKGKLPPEDKRDILELALVHLKVKDGSDSLADLKLTTGEMPSPPTPGKQIKLKSVSNLTNVNALKSDERLLIGDQLTIIYGENATGKSGYARVMKKACRARSIDRIHPNLHAKTPSSAPASATFEIEENGGIRHEVWADGAKPIECLGRFAVFDTKCGRVYLTADNQLSFLPYGFDILESLTRTTDEIKAEIQRLSQKAAPKIDALKPLIDDTAIGKLIASLTAASDEKDITSKAIWTESDNAQLGKKEEEIVQLKLNNPKTVRSNLDVLRKSLVNVRGEIAKVENAISRNQADVVQTKCKELKDFAQAVDASTKVAFADIELTGVGSPVWQELIRAAAKYSTEFVYPGQTFPANEEGVKCVLCQQSLDEKAQDRLKRFWEFIQSEMSTKRDQAKESVDSEKDLLMKLPREIPQIMVAWMDPLRANSSKVPEETEKFFPIAAKRIAALENAIAKDSWDSLTPVPKSPMPVIDLEINAIDEKLGSIVVDGKMDELIEALSKEINEVKARKRLQENLSVVLDHLRSLKESKSYFDAASKINTNQLTATAKKLHRILVTEEFKTGVQDQLNAIGLTRVKTGINEKSQKGKVLHKITVVDAPTVDPEEVFSEGERTAVTLGCFVAELTANRDNCAIILDDPASSFDHRVREGVAKLLVSEATKRQVIIFTHDLVFYRELLSIATRQGVTVDFQHVQALGDACGLVSNIPPWYAMTVGQRIQLLEKSIATAKGFETAGDVERYRSQCRDFFDILRSTWERSVEELLFNGVVQRLEPNVASLKLTGVSVDEEAIAAVFEGMSRTSEMIDAHDPATSKGKPSANPEELQKDLQAFKEFREKQKQKNKQMERKLERLKKG